MKLAGITNKTAQDRALRHISFSRLKVWESSKRAFIDRYIREKEGKISRSMSEGKRVDQIAHLLREKKRGVKVDEDVERELSITDIEKSVVRHIPFSESIVDHEYIVTSMEVDGEEYKMVGEIDYEWVGKQIIEFKMSAGSKGTIASGKKQTEHYDFLRTLQGKKPYFKSVIIVAESEIIGGKVSLTGKVGVHYHKYKQESLDEVRKRVERFVRQIKALFPLSEDD